MAKVNESSDETVKSHRMQYLVYSTYGHISDKNWDMSSYPTITLWRRKLKENKLLVRLYDYFHFIYLLYIKASCSAGSLELKAIIIRLAYKKNGGVIFEERNGKKKRKEAL